MGFPGIPGLWRHWHRHPISCLLIHTRRQAPEEPLLPGFRWAWRSFNVMENLGADGARGDSEHAWLIQQWHLVVLGLMGAALGGLLHPGVDSGVIDPFVDH